jgi:hypothetical protein
MLLLFTVPPGLMGSKAALSSPLWEYEFHSVMPLGSELFLLDGYKGSVLLMATAVSPELDGWRRVNQGGSRFLYAGDGRRVYTYPRRVQFRVTASALDRFPINYDSLAVKSPTPLNDFLLGLQFRIKIFHGLHVRKVEPAHIHMVGVPADITYKERIFRVSFELPSVPVQDRMLLEVLSPQGVRLARFHFELM